ncbi:class I SAM-dependent methyltransferase [Chelatococcus reniformis]|uniref:Methyltransferase n=1 Tax=Chelatococcus reniformis TaxID=1494448 RepID=A0A916X7Z9_9HYPH|nr:class I SAM-dependent methyltransferase [Chelatococcus reniformis]GGC45454.1 methyltransferase [Chelatococcus reniformis]
MPQYDRRYRELKAAGLPGWAGAAHTRGLARLTAALDRLGSEGAIPAAPADLLELGCGNGLGALAMAQRGYRVHGIDLSPTAIAWAEERFAAAGLAGAFRIGDVREMSAFADQSFDIVLDGSCLHCLIDDDDRARCLTEVRRMLRPAGAFIVSHMCGPPKSADAKARFDVQTCRLIEDGAPARALKPLAALAAELTAAGYTVCRTWLAENPWWDHATLVCSSSWHASAICSSTAP